MSNPDFNEAFDRRFRWQVGTGVLMAVVGILSFVTELLFHYDIGCTGFGWSDGLFWISGIAFGTWCVATAGCRRSNSYGAIQRAEAAEVSFTIEDASDGESNCFYVQTKTTEIPRAGWMDWRSQVEQPYPTSRLCKLACSELRGTIWFDSRSAAPLAVRIDNTILLLKKGEPTAFERGR